MTGKFTDRKNFVYQTICAVLLIICLAAAAIFVAAGVYAGALISAVASFIIIPVCESFAQGNFNADDEMVTFHFRLFSYTYKYSEIDSAGVYTGVSNNRFESRQYIQIDINLKNGKTVTFYDFNVPSRVLTTPEQHKIFCDEHQFTNLRRFIDDRIHFTKYI